MERTGKKSIGSINRICAKAIWVSMTGLLMALVLGASCGQNGPDDSANADISQAQEIVDQAVIAMGGQYLDNAYLTFDFRDRSYVYKRAGGLYEFHRIFIDEKKDTLLDILTNDGLIRLVNRAEADLEDKKRQAYSNSVNSVIYFALLPYGLNDPAVIKRYDREVSIRDKSYYQVHVSFREEGGGVDHDDNFLYWFDTEDLSLDFFAYDYITDGGGVRFREAYNAREIGGVVFQDYRNYKPTSKEMTLDQMKDAFERDALDLLSSIELNNIQFKQLNDL